ncbi:hypothetical protein O1M63_43535 [Streptomyces mirabilis]|nr:hypothetical protein [Streptomyces mirabilis]
MLANFAGVGRIDPLAGFRTQIATVVGMTGPAAGLQAQLRQNNQMLARALKIDPFIGVQSRIAGIVRTTGPAAVLQAQIRRNDELFASVHRKMAADAVPATLPSIMTSLRPHIDPLAGFRTQIATVVGMTGPAAGLQAQLRQNNQMLARALKIDPFIGVQSRIADIVRTTAPAAVFHAQLPKLLPDIDLLAGIRSAGVLPSQVLLSGLRTQMAAMDPLASTLRGLADQARIAFPPQLLRQVLGAGPRLLLPDNLRHVRVQLWSWLLRMAAKDGICLAWAPRPELVDMMITLRTSRARHQVLLDHRKEVLEDVTASLSEVDHPDLLVYRELVEDAVDCLVDGKDSAAQALLGNVLDSCMREHGHDWLADRFANAQYAPRMGSHTRLTRALGTQDGDNRIRPGVFTAYLFVTALKNTFGPAAKQATFNRHLAAHHAAKGSYCSEFALSAVLNVQALLRLMDGYLWAKT